MATVLSETHHKLNNVILFQNEILIEQTLVQNRILSIENIDLNKKLEQKVFFSIARVLQFQKEIDMQKEIKEKQDILQELQALKLERDQLKVKVNNRHLPQHPNEL